MLRTFSLLQRFRRSSAATLAATGLVAGVAVGCGGERAAAPTLILGAPTDTIATTLSEAGEAAWLGGARYAVVSPADQKVVVVDLATHAAPTPVGSAAELTNPSTVYAVNDTLYVGDWGRRRLTAWSSAGRLLASRPAPDVARGALPRARDGAGQFYAELYPPPKQDGSGNRDSAAVLRLDPTLARADTIARLAPLDIAEVKGNEGRRFERRVFSGQDRWGILRDGSLWIARVYQNRVDWMSADGKTRVKGQALPDRVLEVTRVDRELFKRRFPQELRQRAEELPYSAVKPPFENAFTGGDGRVWLEKSRAVTDSVQLYHVVDRAGRYVAEVRLPGTGRLLAVASDGTGLVAERTKDGVRLMRVRIGGQTAGR